MYRLNAGVVAGVTAAAVLSLVVGGSGSASAQQGGNVGLIGHGYGHGIGMSQYGAEGAARQGKTHGQILRFYYPGTTIARRGAPIRVLLTGDTTSDVKVSPTRGLAVRDLGDKRRWTLPVDSRITRWRITPNPDRVEYHRNGSWRRWTSPDGRRTLLGDSEFIASGPITLWVPRGSVEIGKRYRGALRSTTPWSGASSRDTVNVLHLESYLRGVVPYEMPASWSREALKAQAVAARSYGVRTRASNNSRYYHICDTTSCQVYGGADGEHPGSDAAIKAVAGQTLHDDGNVALTMFSSSSGGYTVDGGLPYLVAKRDPWDGWSGNPVHDWTKTISASSIERAYPSIGRLVRLRVTRRDGNGEWGGRALTVLIDGTRRNITVAGTTFRSRFALRSTWFTVR